MARRGLSGISKSTVSKLCKDIDDRVNAFLDRPLSGDWPYLWLDAILLEQSDEWATQHSRYMTLETISAVSNNEPVSLSAVPG